MEKSGIQVLARAAAVLRLCGSTTNGLSLGDIAVATKLPRSTVQRIVNGLVAEGLLQADGSRRSIRIGSGLHAIAAAQRVDVIEIAHPFLKQLSAQTGETVDLAMHKGDHLVFVDQVAGSQRLRAISSVGEVFPLHTTANGKAMLSVLPPSVALNVLTNVYGSDGPQLKQALDEINTARINCVAEDDEEHSEGICAIGAAFKVRSGEVYAISIPLPAVRFQLRKTELIALILECRATIEKACETARVPFP